MIEEDDEEFIKEVEKRIFGNKEAKSATEEVIVFDWAIKEAYKLSKGKETITMNTLTFAEILKSVYLVGH